MKPFLAVAAETPEQRRAREKLGLDLALLFAGVSPLQALSRQAPWVREVFAPAEGVPLLRPYVMELGRLLLAGVKAAALPKALAERLGVSEEQLLSWESSQEFSRQEAGSVGMVLVEGRLKPGVVGGLRDTLLIKGAWA